MYCSIKLVGVEGFEPPTSCSQSRRATKLRYIPISKFLMAFSFSTALKKQAMITVDIDTVNDFFRFLLIFGIAYESFVNDQLTPSNNLALNLAQYSHLKRMRNTAWINHLQITLSRIETT